MTLAQFRDRFPEFKQVPDYNVKNALADALLEMDSERVWKDLTDTGQGW